MIKSKKITHKSKNYIKEKNKDSDLIIKVFMKGSGKK